MAEPGSATPEVTTPPEATEVGPRHRYGCTVSQPSARLVVTGLSKTYGGRRILLDVGLEARPGEVVALVGPNGAGKTTLLRCIIGTEDPDAGTVTLDGARFDESDPATRRRVAAVLDDLAWFPDLTAWEHLDLLARAHGDDENDDIVDDALAAVRLSHVADQVPGTLSSGQRRRLGLATTLVRPFDLLFLDEPEQRLDEAGREWLAGYLRRSAADGRTVVMASHDATLVEACGGRVVTIDAPDEVGEVSSEDRP